MSLRFFHLFFISLAALMSFGCGYIEYANYMATQGTRHLAFAVASAIVGLILFVYGIYFFKKSKKFIL